MFQMGLKPTTRNKQSTNKEQEERSTLRETNILAPENGWLEDWFPFGMAYFQGRTVSFREGKK